MANGDLRAITAGRGLVILRSDCEALALRRFGTSPDADPGAYWMTSGEVALLLHTNLRGVERLNSTLLTGHVIPASNRRLYRRRDVEQLRRRK